MKKIEVRMFKMRVVITSKRMKIVRQKEKKMQRMMLTMMKIQVKNKTKRVRLMHHKTTKITLAIVDKERLLNPL